MKNLSSITSYVTGLYGLAFVKETIGLIVLVLSAVNIIINMASKIILHYKQKNLTGVKEDINEAITDLKNLEDKDER